MPGLPRRSIDIAFTRVKLAVFVDGCFWHRCPDHATDPRLNSDYWRPKLERNVERDRETEEALVTDGWQVVRLWEHLSLEAMTDAVAAALRTVVAPTLAPVQAPVMATKATLKSWVLAAVDELGPAGVVDVARWIWTNHEAELRASGNLFYTWQYDIRWAAQALRDEGVLAPVARGSTAVWRRS